jgi:hypothetical protein
LLLAVNALAACHVGGCGNAGPRRNACSQGLQLQLHRQCRLLALAKPRLHVFQLLPQLSNEKKAIMIER